jgi:hypothetical protein
MHGVRVILCGANPGVRLFDGDAVTVFASVWVVDWSVRGAGAAVVLWHDGAVRVVSDVAELGSWLERDFTRHFPEAAGLAWPTPEVETAAVDVRLDFGAGLVARAGDIEVRMSGILDRRYFQTDDFRLDAVSHGLRLVLAPVSEAVVSVAGRRLAGAPTVAEDGDSPTSSAFLTTAEVWLR